MKAREDAEAQLSAARQTLAEAVDTLSKTLADQVVLSPTGRLSLGYQDVPIEVGSLPLATEEVRRLPVPTPKGSVPLEALARVIRGPEPIHTGWTSTASPASH